MKTEYSFEGLDEWEQELTKVIQQDFPAEFKQLVYQIAEELRNKVKENTPTDTTNLQDNWQIGEIVKKGEEYYIEVFNNTEYAEAVEHGHRQEVGRYVPALGKRLKQPFVKGAHMMEISLVELENRLPDFLRDWLSDFITSHEL